jgi:iron(III) transport system ATP-binding protein
MTLRVQGLAKALGGWTILRGVDADWRAGEAVAVIGPSGSGKTTLLRLIAGLDEPDEGTIEIDGRAVSGPGWALEPQRRGMSMQFQRSALWPHMTVRQNVLFGVNGIGRDRAGEVLGGLMADLELDGLVGRYPDQLSGGQARRVALARALAPGRAWLLMDEPLTNVEPDLRSRLTRVLRQHVERTGAGMVYVTHDEAEAVGVADRILRLGDGRLVEDRQLAAASSREVAL